MTLPSIEAQFLTAVAVAPVVPTPLESQKLRTGGLAPWQCRKVSRYIVEHFASGPQVRDLAAQARLSASYFSRAFRKSFGMAPHEMVCRYRVVEAMRLMVVTDWPLSEIAGNCGFADQSHFTRLFQRHVATSPGRWRRANKTQTSSEEILHHA